jgi:hypothetical protein
VLSQHIPSITVYLRMKDLRIDCCQEPVACLCAVLYLWSQSFRQTDRQTDRPTQTHTHTHTHTHTRAHTHTHTQGGYNVESLVAALDSKDDEVASAAQRALSSTLLVFDFLYDVDDKRKAGNKYVTINPLFAQYVYLFLLH